MTFQNLCAPVAPSCLRHRITHIPEVLVADAIRLTDVAVEMLFPEMSEQIVIVEVSLITELAQRMTFVRAVIFISMTTMMTKLSSTV